HARDGTVATGLVEGLTLIPRFWKIDGYRELLEALKDRFELEEVGIDDNQAGNLVAFPYDWRRDIRLTASWLARRLEYKLGLWRKGGGTSGSRVILIAHSMGGLVARYALEKLGAWSIARALITLGTPASGAAGALDSLVNGYAIKRFGVRWLDVTDVL